MNDGSYDLLIIGGGPGGSTAAALARQQNLRVLLLEKCEFPRFRIGESLLPMCNAILRETGAWPKVEAGGFMPKYGSEFYKADGTAGKTVMFKNGLIPGLESAIHVERARFDALLLDHARSLGTDVRMKTAVTSVESTATTNTVTFTGPGGEETITVPWVIDCSGRESSLSTEQKRTLDPTPFPKRMAIYSHFHGVPRASGPNGGNILIVRLDGGWFWLIPIDAERTSVGLVTTVENFKDQKHPPAEFFRQTVTRWPKLSQLLASAKPVADFRVTTDYSYFRRDLARERLILAGDAAGFFDPIFSSGVYMSMETAKQSVEMLVRAHREHRALTKAEQKGYTRRIKRHSGVFQRLIQAFYDDDSFEVFMSQKVPWSLSSGLTSIVAGHAKLSWPLWWRFHFFLTVCRLQKHWKIVKPEHVYAPTLAEA